MDKILVHGGKRLSGHVRISGSKNSALPILAATLLTREPCTIGRIPDLSDIHYMLTILQHLGCEVERASGKVTVHAANLRSTETPYDIVRKMRASVCVMGPLLGRERIVTASLPGGCVIGDRPIDLHLKGFAALGAEVVNRAGNMEVRAERLRGSKVNLRGKFGSTVLGTGNVMMAAVLAEGQTVIEGAAEEPEVADLANFLTKMGANIEGAGTNRIVIEGVKELRGATHNVIADRIEAGTFMVAAAMCGDGVTLHRVHPSHLAHVIETLREIGTEISEHGNTITVKPGAAHRAAKVDTRPYPDFPTDMQAQMCAMLATVPGISVITDNIYPQRCMYVSELKRMGANIEMQGATAVVNGVTSLDGAPVMASDLRASAALVLAGLTATGTTEINRVYHIDRGYENIDDKLNMLGADIERVKA